ncbi:MAG TPA: hypothetical protein VKC60_05495 [Opitutaceae bacterium]|nr:hypothetical protein [Opitutaceae bacterium]
MCWCVCFLIGTCASVEAQATSQPDPVTARNWSRLSVISSQTLKLENATKEKPTVDPLLTTLPELLFNQFFGPVGSYGLDYSDKLKSLSRKRVRVVGFMVREQERTPGVFMLTGFAVSVETKGLCYYDDLPPATVHVLTPNQREIFPYIPGQLVITGVLEIGAHTEADGRISVSRLVLDPECAAKLTGNKVVLDEPSVRNP